MQTGPMLALLRDAAEQGRPGLTLTHRRAAELLGGEVPAAWWSEHGSAWYDEGFEVSVDDAHGWVVFVPAAVGEAPELFETAAAEAALAPLDIRISLAWRDPREAQGPGIFRVLVGARLILGTTDDVATCADDPRLRGLAVDQIAVATEITLSTRGVLPLADATTRALALAVARADADPQLTVDLV